MRNLFIEILKFMRNSDMKCLCYVKYCCFPEYKRNAVILKKKRKEEKKQKIVI